MFEPDTADLFDAYFGLNEDLERLFGRKVDPVMADAARIPSSRQRSLARSRNCVRPESAAFLWDVRGAADSIAAFIADLSEDTYLADALRRSAVER